MTAPVPATDPQQAESVDLERVRHAFEAALAALLLLWLALKAKWVRSLVEQIRTAASNGDVRGFVNLKVDTDEATKVVHEALVAYAKTAADQVVAEAAAQGVTTVTPAELAASDLEDQAAVATQLLADALENSAAGEAARVHPPASVIEEQGQEAAKEAAPDGKPSKAATKEAVDKAREAAAKDTANAVETHLHGLTDAQLRYVLGAVLTGAQNQARIATFLGDRDVDLFADERLDVHSCEPCFQVHGTLLARVGSGDYTLLRRLYPVRGYIDCLGRDRCRGTVVGVWRDRKVSE